MIIFYYYEQKTNPLYTPAPATYGTYKDLNNVVVPINSLPITITGTSVNAEYPIKSGTFAVNGYIDNVNVGTSDLSNVHSRNVVMPEKLNTIYHVTLS